MNLRKRIILAVLFTAMIASSLSAQDISGDWQGTLKAGQNLRVLLRVSKASDGGLSAALYSIDQGPDAIPVSSVSLQDSTLKFSVDLIYGSYEGKLSPDGNTISGTWKQGGALPLEFHRATRESAWQTDSSPHKAQFVVVDQGVKDGVKDKDTDVKLEVLDWGGTGRPLVLLAGLGNNAHVFDKFALKLTPSYHVYGITRRGFGESSVPVSGYSADRLGDDVLAVIEKLKLNHPVLVGHSIAGEELSSIGSRSPEKVAGLIYLDAGYAYAFYNRERGNLIIDSNELEKKLQELGPGRAPKAQMQIVQELLQSGLKQMERDLQEHLKDLETAPSDQPGAQLPAPARAILAGEQKYTDIRVPILAIYAVPHSGGPALKDPAMRAAAEARDLANTSQQAKAFEAGVPTARVVRLPNANHYVFESNEADVLREMNNFLAGLH
jgi:non-heme chloroperoxidase